MSSRLKTKIRAPKRIGVAREDGFELEAIWDTLSTSLNEIHSKNASRLSYEELYRQAYTLVLRKKGEVLYNRVEQLERDWLKKVVSTQIIESLSPALLAPDNTVSGLVARKDAGERLVRALTAAWEDHVLCLSMITSVLMYMDRVYCQDAGRPKIYVTAVCLFRDVVLRHTLSDGTKMSRPIVTEKTIPLIIEKGAESATNKEAPLGLLDRVILDLIEMERLGHTIDRPLIKHCITMLEGIHEGFQESPTQMLYLTVLEPLFLTRSRTFYANEAASLLNSTDASTYLRRAANRLAEEESRCQQCLNVSSIEKVKRIIDDEFIRANIAEVLRFEGTGVSFMIDNDRYSDLQVAHYLNSRIDKKSTELQRVVQQRVVELGRAINASAAAAATISQAKPMGGDAGSGSKSKPTENKAAAQTTAAIQWVDNVVQLKQKFDLLMLNSFDSNQAISAAISRGFSDFINDDKRSSEKVSLFFDENLRKGIKGKTDAEIDALLDNGITLLRYVADKDMFETYYKKHLSRRLLMRRSISLDVERQIISKMKLDVGNTLTGRLEAMFKDMAVSEDLTNNYRTHMQKKMGTDSKRADFEVHVLTSTMWPIEAVTAMEQDERPLPTVIYPSVIDHVKRSFEHFYLDQHNGRKLTFVASMGTADLRATFTRANGKSQRYELNVPTFCMIILLLFNDLGVGESLTFTEILAKTNIPEGDLRRNLQSLSVAPKTRVLRKQPMSREVLDTDVFSFNGEFSSPYTKIKIGMIANTSNKVENTAEREDTEKKLEAERGAVIEAAIVRTMKQRKTLSHQSLMTEVIQQLSSRFKPDPNLIKRKIEALLEREYLERKEDSDVPAYDYLA